MSQPARERWEAEKVLIAGSGERSLSLVDRIHSKKRMRLSLDVVATQFMGTDNIQLKQRVPPKARESEG